MNSGERIGMNRDDREDYLARRELERHIQEVGLDPRTAYSSSGPAPSQRDRRQTAAWLKGGLREYLGENRPLRRLE